MVEPGQRDDLRILLLMCVQTICPPVRCCSRMVPHLRGALEPAECNYRLAALVRLMTDEQVTGAPLVMLLSLLTGLLRNSEPECHNHQRGGGRGPASFFERSVPVDFGASCLVRAAVTVLERLCLLLDASAACASPPPFSIPAAGLPHAQSLRARPVCKLARGVLCSVLADVAIALLAAGCPHCCCCCCCCCGDDAQPPSAAFYGSCALGALRLVPPLLCLMRSTASASSRGALATELFGFLSAFLDSAPCSPGGCFVLCDVSRARFAAGHVAGVTASALTPGTLTGAIWAAVIRGVDDACSLLHLAAAAVGRADDDNAVVMRALDFVWVSAY
jgi:hypothetical protein